MDEALQNLRAVKSGRCGCSLGRCTRLDPLAGEFDAYEPHENNLARHGLPWFYFIPGPHGVIEELREEYVRESETLWGKKHWQD